MSLLENENAHMITELHKADISSKIAVYDSAVSKSGVHVCVSILLLLHKTDIAANTKYKSGVLVLISGW